jgi:ABC-type sugar transport system, permease component
VVCAIVTASLAGYALGRLKFKGKGICFALIMLQMMVPTQIFIIPQYLMVNKLGLLNTIAALIFPGLITTFGTFLLRQSFMANKLGLLNTIAALIFPGLITTFGTFLLRQSFMALPKDLEEAARLDGANIGQTFLYVMAPLTKSSMVALGIFTALFAYKDLMWPLVVNVDQAKIPISAALAKLQGHHYTNYPELMAASLLAIVPMIVLYLIFQRQFIEGIATSGGKL